MKLLFDQNLSFRLCRMLEDIYSGSEHVRLRELHQSDDLEIWKYAREHGFMIVTQDADFYSLALLHGIPPKVIWLRCGNQPTPAVEVLLRNHYPSIRSFAATPELSCLEIY